MEIASSQQEKTVFHNTVAALFPHVCNSTTTCYLRKRGKKCLFSPIALARYLECDMHGHLAEIHMGLHTKQCCNGTLSPHIGEMAHLTKIELYTCEENRFPIPSQLGRLHLLNMLQILGDMITGTLPSELGQLSSLWIININVSRLTGAIPSELGCLTNIGNLWLKGLASHPGDVFLRGSLSGSIPVDLGRLSTLEAIDFSYNQLSKNLPSELGECRHLRSMDFRVNQLSGSLPISLEKLNALEFFEMQINHISGSILFPQDCTLRTLDVADNEISGQIPRQIGKCTTLNSIYAFQNNLRGQIPSELASLPHIRGIQLGHNYLEGSIPEEFSLIHTLFHLGVHNNYLTGSIPKVATLQNLLVFLVHSNNLQGEIPQDLPNMSLLSLHDNYLEGHVPPLSFVCNALFFTPAVFTLYGNQLSCTLPDVKFVVDDECIDKEAWSHPQVFIVPGNRFSLPVPEWLPPAHKDEILFASDDQDLVFSLVCFLVATVIVSLLSRLWEQGRASPVHNVSGYIHVQISQKIFFRFVFWACLLIVPILLLLYWAFGRFYECSEVIIMTTVANFTAPPGIEFFLGCTWVCFGIICDVHVDGFHHAAQSTGRERCFAILQWCAFVPIMLLLGLPGLLYAVSKSVPEHNIISERMGKAYYWCSSCAPVAAYGCDLILNKIASLYSRVTYIKELQVRFVSRAFKMWALPAIVTFLLHENCIGGWRLLSTMCRAGDRSFDTDFFGILLLEHDDLCSIANIYDNARRGRCSRSVVQILTPWFLKQVTVYICFNPPKSLFQCMRWKFKVFGYSWKPLRDQSLSLVSWFQMVIFWTPLIPLLLPFAAIAVKIDILSTLLCMERFGVPSGDRVDDLPLVQSHVRISPTLSTITLLLFSVESKLHFTLLWSIGLTWLLRLWLRSRFGPVPRHSGKGDNHVNHRNDQTIELSGH